MSKERTPPLSDQAPIANCTAAQLMKRPVAERRHTLACAAAVAVEEYTTNRELTDFEAFGEDDLYVESE